jgi:hypothetical protein
MKITTFLILIMDRETHLSFMATLSEERKLLLLNV